LNNIRKLTLGIIGGMGPSATVDLMDKIIKNTPAKKDQTPESADIRRAGHEG